MKSPAFQFYPGDWLSSERVQMMTLEEEGVYIRLLSFCWLKGSIPADPKQITRLVGKGATAKLIANVLPMFQPGQELGRLVHERLEVERAKQAQWREKSREGGVKSARSHNSLNGGSSTVPTKGEPPLNNGSNGGSSTVPTKGEPPLNNGSNQMATLQSSVFSLQSLSPPIPIQAGAATAARGRFVAPSLEEWQRYGQTLTPPFPVTQSDSAFDHYQANGWKQARGNVINNWQAACRNCHRRWQAGGFTQPQPASGKQREPAMTDAGRLMVLKEIDREIEDLRSRGKRVPKELHDKYWRLKDELLGVNQSAKSTTETKAP